MINATSIETVFDMVVSPFLGDERCHPSPQETSAYRLAAGAYQKIFQDPVLGEPFDGQILLTF